MPRQEPRGRHQLVRPPQLLLNPIVQKIRSAIAMRFTRLLACLHARVRVHEAGENLDRDHRGGRVRLGKGAEQFIIFDSRAALFVTGEGSGSRRRQPTTTRCKRR